METAITHELFRALVTEAFNLPLQQDSSDMSSRVCFLKEEEPFFVTCTPYDPWFDAPSRVALWDGTGALPEVATEEAWVEKGSGWYHAYLPRHDATWVATTINGCPERVFIWLDSHGVIRKPDELLETLRAFTATNVPGRYVA